MAERGTLRGELAAGWQRFWGLSWKIKGPTMGAVAVLLIGAATSGGGNEKSPEVTADSDDESTSSTVSAAKPSNTEKATNTPRPTDTPKPTSTPKPTDTPRPTATPAPPTATPEPAGFSFGTGKKIVGADISAGVTYRTRAASQGCYFERLSGFGGSLGEILANENTNGPAIVTIAASDAGFNSTRCGRWTQDLSAITDPNGPIPGDGTFIVGVDMSPGTWSNSGGTSCYWARLSGFSGTLSHIIANANESGTAIVTIGAADKGFTSSRCGTWTKR